MVGEQARFFETSRGAVARSHDRLDAFEPERERERPRTKTICRERTGSGIDLAQSGRGINLRLHVLGRNRERTGLAFGIERLRRRERHGGWRGFHGLLRQHRELIRLLNGLDELDGEDLFVTVSRHRPITNLLADEPRECVCGG